MVIEIYTAKTEKNHIDPDYQWPVLTDFPSTWSAIPRGHINELLTASVCLSRFEWYSYVLTVSLSGNSYGPFPAQRRCIWAEDWDKHACSIPPCEAISWFIHVPLWNNSRSSANGKAKILMLCSRALTACVVKKIQHDLPVQYAQVPYITAVNFIACAVCNMWISVTCTW